MCDFPVDIVAAPAPNANNTAPKTYLRGVNVGFARNPSIDPMAMLILSLILSLRVFVGVVFWLSAFFIFSMVAFGSGGGARLGVAVIWLVVVSIFFMSHVIGFFQKLV